MAEESAVMKVSPTGKRVLVIAGASGESGRAVAARFTADGWTVVALGSNADRLQAVTADDRVVVDLRDAAATATAATEVLARHDRIDGVVHLVGKWSPGHGAATLATLMELNVGTLRNSAMAFWDGLVASGNGRFVMVSSTSVDVPRWRDANYSASKAAAENWMRAYARSWSREATAAAVVLRVTFLGEKRGGTPVADLAGAVARLWDRPVAELNGITVDLTKA